MFSFPKSCYVTRRCLFLSIVSFIWLWLRISIFTTTVCTTLNCLQKYFMKSNECITIIWIHEQVELSHGKSPISYFNLCWPAKKCKNVTFFALSFIRFNISFPKLMINWNVWLLTIVKNIAVFFTLNSLSFLGLAAHIKVVSRRLTMTFKKALSPPRIWML